MRTEERREQLRAMVKEHFPDPHTRIELTREDMVRLWERMNHEPMTSRLTEARVPIFHVPLFMEGRECVAFTVDSLSTDPCPLREQVEKILGYDLPGGEALEAIHVVPS